MIPCRLTAGDFFVSESDPPSVPIRLPATKIEFPFREVPVTPLQDSSPGLQSSK